MVCESGIQEIPCPEALFSFFSTFRVSDRYIAKALDCSHTIVAYWRLGKRSLRWKAYEALVALAFSPETLTKVLRRFPTEEDARWLADALAGIAQEYEVRINACHRSVEEAYGQLVEHMERPQHQREICQLTRVVILLQRRVHMIPQSLSIPINIHLAHALRFLEQTHAHSQPMELTY